jgi:hypothetical protein
MDGDGSIRSTKTEKNTTTIASRVFAELHDHNDLRFFLAGAF